jgi:hypothetical protein
VNRIDVFRNRQEHSIMLVRATGAQLRAARVMVGLSPAFKPITRILPNSSPWLGCAKMGTLSCSYLGLWAKSVADHRRPRRMLRSNQLNILITGGAGYIVSHACKTLAAKGYVPITYDNLSRGHVRAV